MKSFQKIIPYLIVFCITLFSHTAVCCGQFTGEDEAGQLQSASMIIQGVRDLNIHPIFETIATQYHPPLRYIISIPGLLLFPNSEFGLRFGAIILSFLMTFLAMKLGEDLGGKIVGLTSGILIACSPVYNWTSMAFAWSLTVIMLICSIRFLRTNSFDINILKGKKTFILVNLFVIIAFLINTGNILFFVTTLFVFSISNIRKLGLLFKLALPFLLFYGLYFFFFLMLVPYLGSRFFGLIPPFGQLHQLLIRSGKTYINFSSFIKNLQGINGYFFPYLSWILLLCSLYFIIRSEQMIGIWISLFILAWSFYFTDQTHQYFLLVFIAILPFGIKLLHDKLGTRTLILFSTLAGAFILIWNYLIFIKPYGSADINYPLSLLRYGDALVDRVHNIKEPYRKIGDDIDHILRENQYYIHDIYGCFDMFYFPSIKYAGKFGSEKYPYRYDSLQECFQVIGDYSGVQVVVTAKRICSQNFQRLITYPKSIIKLYLLSFPGLNDR